MLPDEPAAASNYGAGLSAAGDVATSARVRLTESCICAICKHTEQVDDKSSASPSGLVLLI